MSLVLSLTDGFRAKSPEFSKNEFRMTEMGITNTFMRQTDSSSSWVTPEIRQKAMMSTGNSLSLLVMDYKDITIRATRPLIIPVDENTSRYVTLTWVTLAYGFHMYPRQHFNNDVDYQLDFNTKFRAYLVKLASTLEGLGLIALNDGKTQVVGDNADLPGGHTFSSDVVHETAATSINNSYIIGDLDALMRLNDFNTFGMDVIGNQHLNTLLNRQEGFGASNQENKQWQWMGKNWQFSNTITNASGKKATGFAVSDGNLAFLTRIEPDSIYRTKLPNGHEWDNIQLPGLGINVGTYGYIKEVDMSSLHAGTSWATRTHMQAFDFAVDVAFVTPYNSDPANIPSPIIKFDVAVA
jgi:hypothetical protein